MATQEQMANLYAKLVTIARSQSEQTIPYSQVASIVGLDMSNPPDRDFLGHLLGYIPVAEVNEGRPMLSSVVWHKGENTIGQGFQKLGKKLHRRRAAEDDDAFLVRELKETHACWMPSIVGQSLVPS